MGSVLKRSSIDLDGTGAAASGHGGHAGGSAKLVWFEGKPVAIEFVCACGERSLIELEYDAAPTPGARPATKN